MKECKGLDELGRCRFVMMMDSNVVHCLNTGCLKEGCEFYDQLTKKEDVK